MQGRQWRGGGCVLAVQGRVEALLGGERSRKVPAAGGEPVGAALVVARVEAAAVGLREREPDLKRREGVVKNKERCAK